MYQALYLECFFCPTFTLLPHSMPPVISLGGMRSSFLSQHVKMPGSQMAFATSHMASAYWKDVPLELLVLFFMKAQVIQGCFGPHFFIRKVGVLITKLVGAR